MVNKYKNFLKTTKNLKIKNTTIDTICSFIRFIFLNLFLILFLIDNIDNQKYLKEIVVDTFNELLDKKQYKLQFA